MYKKNFSKMILLILILFFNLLIIFSMFKLLRIDTFDALNRILNDLIKGKPFLQAIFRVDTESQKHGGELVAQILKCNGVQELFTLCGGHISPILVACENLGIKVYDTRHEVNAVFAADAVARLRQNIGVAAVTAGPGITNSITALKNAQMAESPLLLLGGASPSLLKGRGALQDIDQQILLKPLCKFTARVTVVQDIIPTINKAISIAKSGTPGPVFVELPIDVLYPYKTIEKEIGFSKDPKGFKKLMDFFLRCYIFRVFSDAWIPKDLTSLQINVPMPSKEQIQKLSELIKAAERPLLLLGSQSTSPPIDVKTLSKTIEKLSIPVYLGGMARGLLGANSALQMRQNRKEALKDADLIILAGAVCDFRLGYGRVLNPKSKIVTINRSKEQMLKNHGIFWKSDLAIQADVASTLVQLQNALSLDWSGCNTEWLNKLRDREREKEDLNAKKMLEKTDDGQLNPLFVLKALDDALTDDTILIADGGDFVGSAAYIVRPRGPLQWLDPGAFGTLGVGAGFALGAKAVFPNRPVVIIYGDGACGFSLIEFDTFVRHKLPVIAVIGNDACWSQIARDQVPWFGSAVACKLEYTHYEEVVRGLGAKGLSIEQSDVKEMQEKFKTVLADCKEIDGKSTAINVIIGKTNFREGSISV